MIDKNRKRALRRKIKQQRKLKYEKILRNEWYHGADDGKWINKTAQLYADTPKLCSCYACGNPRRYFGEKTRQELIADYNSKDII